MLWGLLVGENLLLLPVWCAGGFTSFSEMSCSGAVDRSSTLVGDCFTSAVSCTAGSLAAALRWAT